MRYLIDKVRMKHQSTMLRKTPFADMDLEDRFIVSDASAQYHDNFNVVKMQK